jgi:hypothetical protein
VCIDLCVIMTDLTTSTFVRIGSTSSTSAYKNAPSNYVFQAVPLLDQCQTTLQRTMNERSVTYNIGALVELQNTLTTTDELLSSYLYVLLEPARKGSSSSSSLLSPSQRINSNDNKTTIHHSPSQPLNTKLDSSILLSNSEDDIVDGTNDNSSNSARLLRILQEQNRADDDKTNFYHQQTRNKNNTGPTTRAKHSNVGGGRGTNSHCYNYQAAQQYHQYQQHRNPQDPISPTTPQQQNQLSTTSSSSFYKNYSNSSGCSIKRSGVDTLLFRLIVTLQLLLVRIDDAHYVVTGGGRTSPTATIVDHTKEKRGVDLGSQHQQMIQIEEKERRPGDTNTERQYDGMNVQQYVVGIGCFVCAVAGTAGLVASFGGQKEYGNELRILLLGGSRTSMNNSNNIGSSNNKNRQQLLRAAAKIGASLFGLTILNRTLKRFWITDKINRSNVELLEWNHQWELIHRSSSKNRIHLTPSSQVVATSFPSSQQVSGNNSSNNINRPEPEGNTITSTGEDFLDFDDKSRMLIEYAMKHSHRKSYFWRSQGEIRFLLLKRFMDVFYASVGTAINTKHTSALTLPLVTGAAASFYTITGVSKESLNVVNDSSRDLIQHAW